MRLLARAVVFDLDGTLLDSIPAIAASIAHVRAALGLAPLGPGQAEGMVGHGLDRLLEQAFPADRIGRARELYRAHYDATCVEGTRVMPGAREALAALRRRGLRAAVATNKPEDLAVKLLAGLGLGPLLDAAAGAVPGVRLKPAPDLLERALAALRVAPADALYVGDMDVDVATGRAAGVRVIGFAGGAQPAATLLAAGARAVIDRLEALTEIVAGSATDGSQGAGLTPGSGVLE